MPNNIGNEYESSNIASKERLRSISRNINLIKSNPGVKKEQPRTKTGLAERDVKSYGRPMPPGFDGFETFGHDELTAKHCYFRCSRPPDVDGIKIFDKDDQATKH